MLPGNTISLGIVRDGKPQTVDLTVGEFHADSEMASDGGASPKSGKLGLAVNDLTPDARQQLNVPSQVKGAAVQSVRPASPAEDAGLAPGDVIMEVNRRPFPQPSSSSAPSTQILRGRTCFCSSGRRATQAIACFTQTRTTAIAVCKSKGAGSLCEISMATRELGLISYHSQFVRCPESR